MMTAAKAATAPLGERAGAMAEFIAGQVCEDGGFSDRNRTSDLYYTMFGIEASLALGIKIDHKKVAGFLQGFGAGKELDLVHVACLIRCWADICEEGIDSTLTEDLLEQVNRFGCPEGGYNTLAASVTGSAYGCFLAMGAHQDLAVELKDKDGILRCVDSLKLEDGSYSNDTAIQLGTTPATAAAMVVRHYLGKNTGPDTVDWLLGNLAPDGGFTALRGAATADMLSTATAVHALAVAGIRLDGIKRSCVDLIERLWCGGGFCGDPEDRTADCEYTYYALLAMGHLYR